MSFPNEVVITGVGVVSPIGIGVEAFWQSLCAGRSGVRPLELFDATALPTRFGGEVVDFDAKQSVRPRKSLKVMSREIQLGFAAADLASTHGALASGGVDPDRFGVIFGADVIQCLPEEFESAYRGCIENGQFHFDRWGRAAMSETYPLWLLKHLPNMPACHIAIAQDARGPNNSLTLGEVSSLLALAEATTTIQRGAADVMIAGGVGTFVTPTTWSRTCNGELSRRNEEPAKAARPFDADRDGAVQGEGAAAFVLESAASAKSRGVPILARVLGHARTCEPVRDDRPAGGDGIRRAIQAALRAADIEPSDVTHVNANGISTILGDQIEARAIRDVLGDVPVTAPKSYFGNLGSGTGAVEAVVSVLALARGQVPHTLNYERPDPECPVHVVRGEPLAMTGRYALLLNNAAMGQVAAVVLGAGEA